MEWMVRWRHFGHNWMCHRSRTLFFAPEPYANERYVGAKILRERCHSPLSFSCDRRRQKKTGGVVSKEKASKVLHSERSKAKEFVCSEREKEEKANLIKLMQRTNRRPQTHLTKFYIIISGLTLRMGTCMCVLLAFCAD